MGEIKHLRHGGSGQPPEIVDPRLTRLLSMVRSRLGVNRTNNDVIVQPQLPTYEPLWKPNGSMQLGSFGVQDFTERFEQVTEGRHVALYVGYFAIRTEIEEAKKTNVEMADRLLALSTATLRKGYRGSPKDLQLHEATLIGSYAAISAMKLLSVRKPKPVIHAAGRGQNHRLDVENHRQQARALAHFTSKAITKANEEAINKAVMEMAHRRQD